VVRELLRLRALILIQASAASSKEGETPGAWRNARFKEVGL